MALVALVSTAHARTHHHHRLGGLHPSCNITMPCVVPTPMMPPIVTIRVRMKRERSDLPSWRLPFGGGLVEQARAYIGQSAGQIGLHRRTLWCATFLNHLTGGGTGSDLARSWLSRPHVAPQVGAVAVITRRGGGHVGIVSGFDSSGNPIVISGNHGHRVGEGVYPRGRVLAYVSAS